MTHFRPLRLQNLALLAAACSLAACVSTEPVQKRDDDISITQTARGVEIRSSDKILFNTGEAELKPEANAFLNQVAETLQKAPTRQVLIEGHTDSSGSLELNQELSELRALMVAKALVDRGVARARISAKGYGPSKPIASNATQEGKQANRRTDIVIIGETTENLRKDNDSLFDQFSNWSKKLFGQ